MYWWLLWVRHYRLAAMLWVGSTGLVGRWWSVAMGSWLLVVGLLLWVGLYCNSSLSSVGPRPGMPLQGREQQGASLQKMVGIGAKSLDRDLGDVHHSHYLMRQCDGIGGWVRLKYSCKGVGAKCAAGAKQRSDEKRDWRLHPL